MGMKSENDPLPYRQAGAESDGLNRPDPLAEVVIQMPQRSAKFYLKYYLYSKYI